MQSSLLFVLHCDTSSSWIFRKSEQYGKQIAYLAVMFLALNNHQYYIQSSQTERPKESLSLFSQSAIKMTKEKDFFLSLYLRLTFIFYIFSYASVHTNVS